MGKPTICICENKDADQLRGNRKADQRLCFRFTGSTIPLLSKIRNFKLLDLFCDCIGRFLSYLVENHIVGFPTKRLRYQEVCTMLLHLSNVLIYGQCNIYPIQTTQKPPPGVLYYLYKISAAYNFVGLFCHLRGSGSSEIRAVCT